MNKIKNIYWERCNLHIVFEEKLENSDKIFLISEKNKIDISLNRVNKNEIYINITNTPENEMLDKGNWIIFINSHEMTIDNKIIDKLDDKSRIFKYSEGNYTYNVTFDIDENYRLIIETDFYVRNYKYKKYHRLVETKSIKRKMLLIIKSILMTTTVIYYKIISFFSRKKYVLFLTENSKTLSGNLKIMYDRCLENKISVKKYATDHLTFLNIPKFLKEIHMISTSKIIFIDNYTPIFNIISPTKTQKLIQLWHAGIGFKSVGYARFGKDGSPHPYYSGHRKYNYVITDNEKLIPIYQEVFGISKDKLLAYGMPRLDNYLSDNKINSTLKKIYDKYPNLKDKKIILFSPTYRGNGIKDAYYDLDKINLEKIYEFCNENNFIFVIKMHPFIKNKLKIEEKYKKIIIDASKSEINDLIYISDIMITDYSSCAYEYSMFNRPLIFYRYDKELYEKKRTIHTINLFSEIQEVATDFQELINILEKYKKISIKNRFLDTKDSKKNNSCDTIIKEIIR